MGNKYRKEIELVLQVLRTYWNEKVLILYFFLKYFSKGILKTIVSVISLFVVSFIIFNTISIGAILKNFKNLHPISQGNLENIIGYLSIYSLFSSILGLLLSNILTSFFEPAFVKPFCDIVKSIKLEVLFNYSKSLFLTFLKYNLIFFFFETLLLVIGYNFEGVVYLNPLLLILMITLLFLLFFSMMFFLDMCKISSAFGGGMEDVKRYIGKKLKEILNIMVILSIPHVILFIFLISGIFLILSKVFFVGGIVILLFVVFILDILTEFLFVIYFSVFTVSFKNFLTEERS